LHDFSSVPIIDAAPLAIDSVENNKLPKHGKSCRRSCALSPGAMSPSPSEQSRIFIRDRP
jgi:hypothetical protein